jgi:hypothetical protein
MSAPTTLTITYLSGYTSGAPTTTATVTSNIPAGIDATQHVRNLAKAEGVWTTSAAGVKTFIVWDQVISITAQ